MIRVSVQDGVTRVWPEGGLGIEGVSELQRTIVGGAEDGDVVVDLSSIQILSSSAIGALIAGHNALRAKGRRLRVEGVSAGIRHLMRMMGLDRHFDIA